MESQGTQSLFGSILDTKLRLSEARDKRLKNKKNFPEKGTGE